MRGSLGAEGAVEADWPYRTGQALGLTERGLGQGASPTGHAGTLEKKVQVVKMINWLRLIPILSWWLGLFEALSPQ
jgi:hypothetical protein